MLMGYGLWTVQSSQTYQGRTSFGLRSGSLYCVLCTLVPDCKFSVHSTMQRDRSTNGKSRTQSTKQRPNRHGECMPSSMLQSRMKNLLLFVPNLVVLCGKLMVDPRVPAKERLLVAGAIVYAIVPLDLIPDMIPFVGQIDDAYLIALSLLRLMTISEPEVVREHWRGGGDVVELIGSTALISAKFLPKKIRRVLTSRVEDPRAKGSGKSMAPILIERPQVDPAAKRD